MKCLSIQQPWAWAILYAGKDIENRTWKTNERGKILIHAGKKFDHTAYETLINLTDKVIPISSRVSIGGIIGMVEIVDCVTSHESKWFFGPYGFVLKNPRVLPFMPCRGQLGFFDVDYNTTERKDG
jgi:hypothetical protein